MDADDVEVDNLAIRDDARDLPDSVVEGGLVVEDDVPLAHLVQDVEE